MSGASKESLGARGLPAAGKACLTTMDRKLNALSEKVDKLLHFQEDVSEQLQSVCQGMDHLEQGLHRLEAARAPGPASAADAQTGWPEVLRLNKDREEEKGAKPQRALSTRGVQAELRGPHEESQTAALPEGTAERLPPVGASGMGSDVLAQPEALPGQGDRVPGPDQMPPEHLLLPRAAEAKAPGGSGGSPETSLELSAEPSGVSEAPASQEAVPGAGHGPSPCSAAPLPSEEGMKLTSGPPSQAKAAHGGEDTPPRIPVHVQETPGGSLRPAPPAEAPAATQPGEQDPAEHGRSPQAPGTESGPQTLKGACACSPLPVRSGGGGAEAEDLPGPVATPATGPSRARRDTGDDAGASGLQQDKGPGAGNPESELDCTPGMPQGAEAGSLVLDDSPAPPAPFEHRMVSVKETAASAGYTVCQDEVLGGGRFGQVHRCTEKSTGLSLAAKIIKVKSAKDREDVKNEIAIMNQLSHVNLIQLYDAFESKGSFTLVMEYVDGGELFDRITDERYHLTELDVILFTKQICEGVHHLHQHYILHLDLKPENILCVNQTGHQIKIIDFGLARRYKPREKLKVNFGTPEFLAPEVVNYEFVSFPTDMWSVGVITYMLLSGLSPFLGDTDAETMNFIVNCCWDFDADTFEGLSEDAKDFVSRLLVKEKSCRMSATQCLKHEWLNNLPAKASKSKVRLKSQLLLQKYLAQRKWKVPALSKGGCVSPAGPGKER
uniref:Myosin light chain kinase 3 n=1 Tax=Molossus molossus TaxID=27622 RepID=A0A7J8C9J8_MOLMO|nr:myosin light chain kinase 3 [Molossus molossus]